jgi:hypothetical protein
MDRITTVDASAATGRTSGLGRRAGLAALGFAALYFASMVLTDVPTLEDSEVTARSFYAVGHNRVQAVLALYVLASSMGCFLVLTGELVRRLRASGGGTAAEVAAAAGAWYAALSLVAGAAFAAPAASVVLNLGGGGAVDPAFARSAATLGDALMLLVAPLVGSLFVAAVCVGGRRTGLLPVWLIGSGLVVAVALLAGVLWFPLLLLLAWVAALGIASLRTAAFVPTAGAGGRTGRSSASP